MFDRRKSCFAFDLRSMIAVWASSVFLYPYRVRFCMIAAWASFGCLIFLSCWILGRIRFEIHCSLGLIWFFDISIVECSWEALEHSWRLLSDSHGFGRHFGTTLAQVEAQLRQVRAEWTKLWPCWSRVEPSETYQFFDWVSYRFWKIWNRKTQKNTWTFICFYLFW